MPSGYPTQHSLVLKNTTIFRLRRDFRSLRVGEKKGSQRLTKPGSKNRLRLSFVGSDSGISAAVFYCVKR